MASFYDTFLNELEGDDTKADFYLISGHRYVGRVEGHDDRCVVIINDSGTRQMLNWSAITVVSAHIDDSTDKRYRSRQY